MNDAGRVHVPSGMPVTPIDVIQDAPGPGGMVVRFRFLAPAIGPGGGVDFETAATDLEYLCQTYALPKVKDNVPPPTQIIVSFTDREIAFGESSPDVTQFFEAYRIEDGTCVWDAF